MKEKQPKPAALKGGQGTGSAAKAKPPKRGFTFRNALFLLFLLAFSVYAWMHMEKRSERITGNRQQKNEVSLLMIQAVAEENEGNMEAAALTYRKITAIDPLYAPAYNNLANIFQKRGFLDVAVLNYKKALGIDSTLISARYNLALTYHDKGYYLEAIREWRRLLTFDADSTLLEQTKTNIRIANEKASEFR